MTQPDSGAGGSGGVTGDLGGAPTASGGTLGGDAGNADGLKFPGPAEFTRTNTGGYKLGPAIVGEPPPLVGVGGGAAGCDTIVGVVRDFKFASFPEGHPDFESFQGCDATKEMVAAALGPDNKPVYTSVCEAGVANVVDCPWRQQSTSKARFDQWYRTVDGVNKPFVVFLLFAAGPGGLSTFYSDHFYPLDGAGWGNMGSDISGRPHNFSFTTEVHTKFRYNGAETFTFSGDDDLWVFINGKRALDLGGLHPPVMGTIDLDAQATTLDITKGKIYPLDLFHAERHTGASNFRVDTNFAFVDCGIVVP